MQIWCILIDLKKKNSSSYYYSSGRKLFLERTHQIGKRSFAQLLMKLNWFDFIISIDLTNNVPALLSNSFGVSSWALILHWVFSSGNLMSKEATKLWVGIKTIDKNIICFCLTGGNGHDMMLLMLNKKENMKKNYDDCVVQCNLD